MSQVCPGEAREKEGSKIFQGDPQKGSQHDRMGTEPRLQVAGQKGEGSEKQAQITDQKQENENAQHERDVSIRVHGEDDPVNNADERNEPGEKPEYEPLEQTLSLQRKKERDEGKPGQGFEIIFGERKDEEDG